ncbi:MAG: sulfatase [Verrucomicrobia bacterium]|nr:MAG: sulfatase [Verrucomicrobiota bacterium]
MKSPRVGAPLRPAAAQSGWLWLLVAFAAVVTGFPSSHAATAGPRRPNVVLVMTDDQGYGDFGCHGNPVIETPNLDRLHAESVRFTDFHVDPTCAPTRAALMTGRYAHHVGVWHTVCGGNHLRRGEVTMAELFRRAGYRTALFGKWHLGSNYPYRPMDRGFEEWLGQGDGGTGTTDDWFDNDRVNDRYWHNGVREARPGFAVDVFFDAAIDYIRERAAAEEPFFVYLATYVPHHPHTLPDPKLAEKYRNRVPADVAWFFASIEYIDRRIGDLRAALEASGVADDTLFIFLTDNGGTAGVRVFNAGMRGYKGQVYEGGHRVPLFIRWPAGGLAHGREISQLTCHFDILPTLVELCDLPADGAIQFDGRSFGAQLRDPSVVLPERIVFFETQRTFVAHPWAQTAGMTGRWRLVNDTELYDLSADPAQAHNCIADHPALVERMRAAHRRYWAMVTPGDREPPRFVVGTADDPEVYLHPSDWHLPDVPWNHAQVAAGSPLAGSWHIEVARPGKYRFEVRRWPREARAPIAGVPVVAKQADAWAFDGPVEGLIYGGEMQALPVEAVALHVGAKRQVRPVKGEADAVVFDIDLEAGEYPVEGRFLDRAGRMIAGAYYIYISPAGGSPADEAARQHDL